MYIVYTYIHVYTCPCTCPLKAGPRYISCMYAHVHVHTCSFLVHCTPKLSALAKDSILYSLDHEGTNREEPAGGMSRSCTFWAELFNSGGERCLRTCRSGWERR